LKKLRTLAELKRNINLGMIMFSGMIASDPKTVNNLFLVR
jgi:hypothetical protein